MHDSDSWEQAIRRRAQELYEERGRVPGHEVEDWLRAEAEVKRESEPRAPRPAYVSVKVEGVTYIGEYDAASCQGYQPGEFRAGDQIRVMVNRDKMVVVRPNGVRLETRVVRASGSE